MKDQVHVSFTVRVTPERFGYKHDEMGEAELEFDIKMDGILNVDYSPLLVSLL